MHRDTLIAKIAEDHGISKAQAFEIVETVAKAIPQALAADGEFTWPGFGTFAMAQRGERTGRNPRTGEPLTIPAKAVPVFRTSAGFRRLAGVED